MRFTVTYDCKYELKFAPNYKWTQCGKCFNSKTGRQIKIILKGRSKGYVINSKFYTLSYLRTQLQRITKYKSPF